MADEENEIREGLAQADGGGEYDLDREETFRQMMAESFHGKMRWMTILAWEVSITFTAVAVFAAICFFQTDARAVRGMIAWAALFALASMIVFYVKLWFWMLMNRNSVKREIKRLELRIASLTEALHHE